MMTTDKSQSFRRILQGCLCLIALLAICFASPAFAAKLCKKERQAVSGGQDKMVKAAASILQTRLKKPATVMRRVISLEDELSQKIKKNARDLIKDLNRSQRSFTSSDTTLRKHLDKLDIETFDEPFERYMFEIRASLELRLAEMMLSGMPACVKYPLCANDFPDVRNLMRTNAFFIDEIIRALIEGQDPTLYAKFVQDSKLSLLEIAVRNGFGLFICVESEVCRQFHDVREHLILSINILDALENKSPEIEWRACSAISEFTRLISLSHGEEPGTLLSLCRSRADARFAASQDKKALDKVLDELISPFDARLAALKVRPELLGAAGRPQLMALLTKYAAAQQSTTKAKSKLAVCSK